MHTASDLETGKAWELDKLVNVEFKTCCVHKSFQLCVYRHPFLSFSLSSSVVGGPAWWEERSVSLDILIFIDLWQLRTGKVQCKGEGEGERKEGRMEGGRREGGRREGGTEGEEREGVSKLASTW